MKWDFSIITMFPTKKKNYYHELHFQVVKKINFHWNPSIQMDQRINERHFLIKSHHIEINSVTVNDKLSLQKLKKDPFDF